MHELQKLVMLATSCCMGKAAYGAGGFLCRSGTRSLLPALQPTAQCGCGHYVLGGLAAEAILRHADQVMHPALLGLALPVLQTQDL